MALGALGKSLITFACIIGIGFLGGLLYDFYRACGRILYIKRRAVFVGDLLFWLLFTAAALILLLLANQGEVRFYVFLALVLGILFYSKFFSRFFYLLFCRIFELPVSGIRYFVKKIKKIFLM
jgi:spore cortex biosynthesis protein YabQ